LPEHFAGYEAGVRELTEPGDPQRAINYFMEVFSGQPYSYYYTNCTDVPWKLSIEYGIIRLFVKRKKVTDLLNDKEVIRFMEKNNMSIPEREYVLFPEEFKKVGIYRATVYF